MRSNDLLASYFLQLKNNILYYIILFEGSLLCILVELGIGGLLGVVDEQFEGNRNDGGQTQRDGKVALDGRIVQTTQDGSGAAGGCWRIGHVNFLVCCGKRIFLVSCCVRITVM